MYSNLICSNNRLWERERRNKLNDAFGQLDRQLPDFDPSRARSKLAVLLASIAHIGHLQQLVETLSGEGVGGGARDATQRDNVYGDGRVARLHDAQLTHCCARCQQLRTLLQMATFRFPAPPPLRLGAQRGGVHRQSRGTEVLPHKTVKERIYQHRKV
ncbi:hypothetical protein LSTR_LSTR015582 [Laodelphax striatellus]|uniref:BHLH domain-containing protein n=1 Tax=Laodelphax striatellus TaxID=195883 RepID=A0A482XWA4_LAOST|nr:hypothetical protein LSTR_LSTR015582 [Laodelphax striatellus]